MNAATEKQIAFLNSLLNKLATMEIKPSRFCPARAIPSMREQYAKFAAEVEAALPTLSKNKASAYIGDLISMTR
jgi:hypothetical protein